MLQPKKFHILFELWSLTSVPNPFLMQFDLSQEFGKFIRPRALDKTGNLAHSSCGKGFLFCKRNSFCNPEIKDALSVYFKGQRCGRNNLLLRESAYLRYLTSPSLQEITFADRC